VGRLDGKRERETCSNKRLLREYSLRKKSAFASQMKTRMHSQPEPTGAGKLCETRTKTFAELPEFEPRSLARSKAGLIDASPHGATRERGTH